MKLAPQYKGRSIEGAGGTRLFYEEPGEIQPNRRSFGFMDFVKVVSPGIGNLRTRI